MRAIVVTPGHVGSTRLEEIEEPTRSPDDVVVRVLEIGICGTDREIDRGEVGSAPDDAPWLVLGHEVIGVVERDTAEFSAGELVTATVRRPCASCANCRDGSADSCLSGDFRERGIKELHGFAANRFVESPEHLIRIPAELGRLGVLAEPISICERGLRHSRAVHARQGGRLRKAVVVGVGSIGLLTTMLLRLREVETYALSRSPLESDKARLVRATGAHYASTAETPLSELVGRTDDADLVVEAAGDARAAVQCLDLVGTNGVACLLGVDPRPGEVALDADVLAKFVTGNRALLGSVNAHTIDWVQGVADLTEMLRRWPDALNGMIGLSVAPEDFRQALDFLGIKATIRFS